MGVLAATTIWAALLTVLVEAGETEPWKAYPVSVETTTETLFPTCPPPLTVESTQYVPTTIYKTIISTDIVTTTATQSVTETQVDTQFITETIATPTTELITDFVTETTPTTLFVTAVVTETVSTTQTITQTITETTPTSLTLTATQKEEIHTSTERFTSLKICPTRIANPSFTVVELEPFPNDWTWGCPPGWLCKPLQESCDFEAGLPDPSFKCAPNECIPAEALPQPLLTWDTTIYGNSTPLSDPSLKVQAIDDYFNMNPTDFGLDYSLFIVDREVTYTETIVLPPNPTAVPRWFPAVRPRQGQTSIPGQCYTWCNNCLLEVQSLGKTPRICQPGSSFLTSLGQCQECIDYHSDAAVDTADFVRIAPQFQQFIDYCDGFTTTTTVATSVTSTTESGQTTITSLVETTALTAVPTSDLSSPSLTTETGVTGIVSTITSTLAPTGDQSTYTGGNITPLVIVLPTGGSLTTLSGSELEDATLILPAKASVTEIETSINSSYTSVSTIGQSDEPSSTLGDETSAIEPASTAAASSSPEVPPVDPAGAAAGLEVSAGLLLATFVFMCIFI